MGTNDGSSIEMSASLARYRTYFLLFCHSVMSDSLRPHGLQHARLPCPSLSPWVCSNSCPLSQWYHPTIASSVIPFSPCPQSFPASGSFPVSQLFAPSGQSTGASASASVLPTSIQGWFPLGLTGLISFLLVEWCKIFLVFINVSIIFTYGPYSRTADESC